MSKKFLVAICLALPAAPLQANSLIEPGLHTKIARSTLSASPTIEWNRLSRRGGKNVEVWTIDSDLLNKVTFFGGIEVGGPLFREANRKDNPLPRVMANMLITDIPEILEKSYRIQGGVTQMTIDSQEPELVGGHNGVRFTYTLVRQEDEVERKGEAIGAFVKNRLYIIAYEAPALHFFDKDIANFRQLASTVKL